MVVGTSQGYVYALHGATGQPLWRVKTFSDNLDSEPNDFGPILYTESHNEEVRGLAVGNLNGMDPSRATIVVCSGTFQGIDAYRAGKATGHMMILDCGPNTWNPNLADWPQWQRTPQRTGTLGLP